MLWQNLENFVRHFSKLPGVGAKTAERLGFYLLSQPQSLSESIAESILELRKNTVECGRCGNLSDSDPCPICDDSNRNEKTICVVESALDIYAIEATSAFSGLYHVLGGLISPLEGVTPSDLKLDELFRRAKDLAANEVIVALSPTTEGDTTSLYIAELFKETGVNVTNLARGIPVGTDLQFAGSASLREAFRHREKLD